MKKIIKNLKSISILFSLFWCTAATAQNAGEIDPTFNPTDRGFNFGVGTNQAVSQVAVQPDGRIVVVGEFTRYNGATRKGIARILPDGWVDTTFEYVTNAFATRFHAVAIQADGKIIVGGSLGATFLRLENNGAIDDSFNAAAEGPVNTIVVQNDGKILIGGEFRYYNSRDRKYIARLNADGTLDTTFKVGTGASDFVNTIAVQADGKVLIAGEFTSYNGNTANHIARLNTDGSFDTTFTIQTIANDEVNAISVLTNGKLILGGHFGNFGGIDPKALIRIDATGELDTTFVTPRISGNIYATDIQPDGKILVGGYVVVPTGSGSSDFLRFNADGSLDTTFNNPHPVTGSTYDITQQADGKIIIAGQLGSYDGVLVYGVARVKTDGYLDKTFNIQTGSNSPIQEIVELENGQLILAGEIYTYNGRTQKYFTRINSDGSSDDSFYVNAVDYEVYTVAEQANHKLVIGGSFYHFDGVERTAVARVNEDGTLDPTFVSGAGPNTTIRKIILQGESKIIIAGVLAEYDSVSRNGIARLNGNGSLDHSFDPGTGANDRIWDVALQTDGKIVVVGEFETFNGVDKIGIVRLNSDGSIDSTFNNGGAGIDGYGLRTVNIQPDGKIIITGSFTTYNGVTAIKIARLNEDGTLDATFNTGLGVTGTVYSTNIQSDGKIIIGGDFTKYNGVLIKNLARLLPDGTLDTDFNVGTGPNYYLTKTTVQRDGKILIAGAFTDYNKIGRNRITRLIGSPTTGIKELPSAKQHFSVFPNPSNDHVTLNFYKDIKNGKLKIMNELGQAYKTVSFAGNSLSIQDMQLAPGIYFFQVTSGSDFIGTEKVVVQ